nr:MAG TPA: hypothetical protein [Caudoviricetes sp.]
MSCYCRRRHDRRRNTASSAKLFPRRTQSTPAGTILLTPCLACLSCRLGRGKR